MAIIVKGKQCLCQTSLSDWNPERVNGIWFYNRYQEFVKLFSAKIPTVNFEKSFAQPVFNDETNTIEWFTEPMREHFRLSDATDETAVAEQQRIISAIESVYSSLSENDSKYIAPILQTLKSDSIDTVTYYCDGRVVFGVWGMVMKKGKVLTDVIIDDIKDHRVHRVTYSVQGSGKLSFSDIVRRHGHELGGERDIPSYTPDEGYIAKEWVPESPSGVKVDKPLHFTIVFDKDPNFGQAKPSDTEKIVSDVTGESDVSDKSQSSDGTVQEPERETNLFNVRFVSDGRGTFKGQTVYAKKGGDRVLSSEIPQIIAKDGYKFVGWDKDPIDHIVTEDVVFTALYEPIEIEETERGWWHNPWGLLSGCLGSLLALLLLGLIAALLWFLLGKHDFNFCGCDCDNGEYVVVPDTIRPEPKVVPDSIKPEPKVVDEDDDLPKPTKSCGVHFSGWFLSDKNEYPWIDCSKIFEEEEYGEYVGQGYYPDNTKILPKSMRHSFDAVAVSKGTRLIIYSKPNFEGKEVLNVKGPILIENVVAKGKYDKLLTYTFSGELQEIFPPERRQWSSENMHNWANGSCKIICE